MSTGISNNEYINHLAGIIDDDLLKQILTATTRADEELDLDKLHDILYMISRGNTRKKHASLALIRKLNNSPKEELIPLLYRQEYPGHLGWADGALYVLLRKLYAKHLLEQ
jgi:hypothetical protein